MSEKIIISKPGFNAGTESNPDNLIFSSDYNTLKYYASGSINVAYNDNNTIYIGTVSHNLGYIPFFMTYVPTGGQPTLFNLTPDNRQTGAGAEYYNAYADSANLYFTAFKNKSSGIGGTETFYYKIFKNNLGL
jgi:hypothetical protein